MKELLAAANALAKEEYARATEKFGKANHSDHESYAIIKEEFEEAEYEHAKFKIELDNFWRNIKHNGDTEAALREMHKVALLAAAEWVQVAAMCYKATVPVEKMK